MGKWVYSTNSETFNSDLYDSKENAIQDAISDHGDDYEFIYVGQVVSVHPRLDVEDAIERAVESLYDDVGEVAEGYLESLPKEELADLQEKIDETFKQWLIKYSNEPTFYKVENIESIKI